MVYNTDLARPQIWNGSEWKILGLRLTFPMWTNSTKPSTAGLPNGYAGWNSEEGTERYTTEINVNEFTFLTTKKDSSQIERSVEKNKDDLGKTKSEDNDLPF